MHTITPLTPFQRGQAALQDALAHVDYAADSDERMQFLGGLLDAAFAPGVDDPQPPARALIDAALGKAKVELADDLAKARMEVKSLKGVLHDMAQQLAPVIAAHLRRDAMALTAALDNFIESRCKVIHHPSPAAGSGAAH